MLEAVIVSLSLALAGSGVLIYLQGKNHQKQVDSLVKMIYANDQLQYQALIEQNKSVDQDVENNSPDFLEINSVESFDLAESMRSERVS